MVNAVIHILIWYRQMSLFLTMFQQINLCINCILKNFKNFICNKVFVKVILFLFAKEIDFFKKNVRRDSLGGGSTTTSC